MKLNHPRLRESLAGEYVIGTLSGAARRRFERYIERDPRLRAEVEIWEQQLAPIAIAVAQTPPPARVWASIAARIEPSAQVSPPGFWSRLWVWRAACGFAVACTLVLAVTLGAMLDRPPGVRYVAVVLDAQARGAWLVSLNPQRATATARPLAAQTANSQRAFELWLLPASGAPRSLGVLNPKELTAIDLAAAISALLPSANGLAVSIEPAGGSPTGQPTGAVRFQGALVKL